MPDKIDVARLAREAAEHALKHYKPHGPLAYAYENVRNEHFARLVLEEAAKEAEHWQTISRPEHKCGEYIAAAIRGMKP